VNRACVFVVIFASGSLASCRGTTTSLRADGGSASRSMNDDAGTDAGSVASSDGGDVDGGNVGDGTVDVASARDASRLEGEATHGASLVAYASGFAPGIAIFSVDPSTGALTPSGGVTSFGNAPSFLAINTGVTNLYALDESSPGRVGAYAIDPATGALTFLNAASSGGNGPAFVGLDRSERYVLVANYTDGTVSVLPVLGGGGLGSPIQTLSVGAQAHMVAVDPSGQFVFVPCRGADYVAEFLFDARAGILTPNAVPRVGTAAGAGPRHLAFHPNGLFAYLINELDSTMTAYAFDAVTGTLTAIETQSTLPAGFTATNTAAEVWVHPSGAWVLGSNRGDDSIVVFAIDPSTGKMTLQGHTKTGGTTPRDFTLDPTGAFVYAANQGSGSVVPFAFDVTRGTLMPVGTPVSVASASFIGLVRLPASP
jgi:6-phosphogluconolactonase